ncbi:MAG: glycosyltransferase family 39 protein [Pseudomonadales bacterium]|uniref:Glycosyl transferase family 39 n=1 Tax=Oleiphilus messinensis TaxID=141451 RepID=A0A1Y0IEJ1_9GAMM|nr:glycosyltransferase family 39 protein [Oleiphilus messinensis]ARU57895.1 glycosyl transferase family 39 [Oleiphilus messinensis]MCG8610710.1 glycosyltransferase family 39 protein [Pseudomonadales bacterium]
MTTARLELHADRWLTTSWFLLLCVVVGFFANNWNVPLFDLDEGAFSEATREMLASGNFSATYLNGEPRYDKPILVYWLQALSVTCFGNNEFAYRLPSALAATAWAWAIFTFAREILNVEKAKIAVLIFTTSLIVTIIGRAATADALLNLVLSLTLLDIYRYLKSSDRKILYRIYFWMALGVLTKGPVAIFFPLLISLIYCLINGAGRVWLQAVLFYRGWLVLLAVILPWCVAVWFEQGGAFFMHFLGVHNIGRFAGTMHGHGGNPFYYLAILPVILLPYTGLCWQLFVRFRAIVQEPLSQYLAIWFGVVFLFFSVSQTQLPHYLLYGGTPLFILMAHHIQGLTNRWLALLPFALFLLLLIALPWGVSLALPYTDRAYEHELLTEAMIKLGTDYKILLLLSGGLFVYLVWAKNIQLWQKLLLCGFMQSVLLSMVVAPVIANVVQTPVKKAALVARQYDENTVAFEINMPSFSVYLGDITPRREPEPGELAFTRVDKLERLNRLYPESQQELLFSEGGIRLIKIREQQ